MSDAAETITIAVRGITRHHGETIWSDGALLRSRLDYVLGDVAPEVSALVDAVVVSAVSGVPDALVGHGDLPGVTRRVLDEVGPVLGARAVALWARALAGLDGTDTPTERAADPAVNRASRAGGRSAGVDATNSRTDDGSPSGSSRPAHDGSAVTRMRRRGGVLIGASLVVLSFAAAALIGGEGPEPVASSLQQTATSLSAATTARATSSSAPASRAATSTVETSRAPTTAATPTTAPTAPPTTAAPVTPPTTLAATIGGEFVWPATPQRVLDTRSSGPISSATVQIAGVGSLPSSMRAALVKIRLEGVTAPGSAAMVVPGAPTGTAAQMQFVVPGTFGSTLIAPLSSDGRTEIRLLSSPANIIIDVLGFVAGTPAAGGLSLVQPPTPFVVRDGNASPLAAAATVDLSLAAGSAGALLAVTASSASVGAIAFSSTATTQDSSPTVFVGPAETNALLYVRADAQGRVKVHNTSASPVRLAIAQVALFVAGPRPDDALTLSPRNPVAAARHASCSNTSGAGLTGVGGAFPGARALMLSVTLSGVSNDGVVTIGGQSFGYSPGAITNYVVLAAVTDDRIALSCSAGRPTINADVIAVFA